MLHFILFIILLIQSPSWYAPDGIAVSGYDLVSYFSGAPLEGTANFSVKIKDVTFYFSSQKNKDLFIAEPEKYFPQYNGWCAYAMGKSGEKVKINPNTFTLKDGKLYLFYNFWGNNTLRSWKESEEELMLSADQNWLKYAPE